MGTATAATTTTMNTHHAAREAAPGGNVDDDGVCRALGRHAQRRRQGIPTLSVLFVEDAGEAAWQRWVAGAGAGLRAESVFWPRAAEDLRALGGGVAPLWVPPPPRPAGEPGDRDGLTIAVDLLAAWLERAVPPGAWVCGLLVPAAGAAAYLARAPESRAKAYFREGLIGCPPLAARPVVSAAVGAGAGGVSRPAHAAVCRAWGEMAAPADGAVFPEEALARVFAAADALDAAPGPDSAAGDPAAAAEEELPDDGARSAAERFLFAVLDVLPGTAGVFALNAPLPGSPSFGPRPAEVDLLALGPRVAVEIDGFHHFTDPARYRRDRRKDVLLQEHGFLVLRFLAEDVVPRLETILDEIRAALARRRDRPAAT